MATRMLFNPDDVQVERLFVLGDDYAERQRIMESLCDMEDGENGEDESNEILGF